MRCFEYCAATQERDRAWAGVLTLMAGVVLAGGRNWRRYLDLLLDGLRPQS